MRYFAVFVTIITTGKERRRARLVEIVLIFKVSDVYWNLVCR